MRKLLQLKLNQKGVSLVELLLVVAAIAFLALLINNIPSSIRAINKSRHASLAKDIASKELDYLRRQTYANLALSSSTFTDSGLASLPSASATYEVEDCPESICSNDENLKKVKVVVSWKEVEASQSVELDTLVGQGGLGQY